MKVTSIIISIFLISLHTLFAQSDTLILSLDSAINIATSENPSIQIAGKKIDIQKQANAAAWEQMFSLSATGQYSRAIKKNVFYLPQEMGGAREIGYNNSYNLAISASLVLVSPTLWKSIAITKTDIEIAVEAVRASKITLINEVKKAYYAAMFAEDALAVLQQSLNVAQKSFDNIKLMYTQGLVAEYDMIRADVSVRNIKPTLVQMQNSVDLTKMLLKVLLSLPTDMPIKVEGSLTDMEKLMSDEVLINGFDLSENTDLRSIELNIKKMQQQKVLVNMQRIPSLAAFGQWQTTTQADDFKFNNYMWNYPLSVGLQLNIPLWDIYAKSREAKQVKIGIEQLQMQQDYLKQNLGVEAQNSLNKMLQAKEQLGSNKEGMLQAQKGLDITQVRYNSGSGTILELNDAQMALVQSKLNYNQAIYDYLVAKFELEKLLGKE
ncbi:MAG: TolC family protein [Bacteroidales bacterium]|jgi:outer membrane protein TolC|nr:TolC family protein [Bacteroidales bacterium]